MIKKRFEKPSPFKVIIGFASCIPNKFEKKKILETKICRFWGFFRSSGPPI